ncbi:MAG: uroporphyrinogen-III C-methyltransferase [Betaproteobacteria bacterium]|nr:uroporphyrinogen-III C-methyltransferase [Betaproteobacteria bacterium]
MNSTLKSSAMRGGKVWLIGAGPGDTELLTLKAVRALAEADVVLIDDLANRDVLVHAKPDVRVIEVGKRGGCKSTPQAFIEKLMVRLAKAGATVARVKGGDPFVFGRGGEEMLALRAAGIGYEIVPGITSGMAVPASIGIPVTHRDFSRGVTFVTGHSAAAEPKWAALAQSGTTLVIYMGVANLPRIQAALIAAGMPSDLPACAIQNGTRSDARCIISTLGSLHDDVAAASIGSPAIMVIGEVVSLANAQVLACQTQVAA